MSNDLTSREWLKDAFDNLCCHNCKMCRNFKIEDSFYKCNLIENAPTVEPCYQNTSCLDCGNYDKENHNCPRYCEVIKEAINSRPQGEWIAREDMDYLDENKVVHNHFECNKCGLIHDFIDGHTSQYNFCPECGVRMQKGGTKE